MRGACRHSPLILLLLLAAVGAVAAQEAAAAGGAAVRKPHVWLYSLVSADWGGQALLPHWLQHYYALGIEKRHIHIDVLHEEELLGDGPQAVADLLVREGIHYDVVNKKYGALMQEVHTTASLHEMEMDPEDYVIVADSDEFYTYNNCSSIHDAVRVLEAERATYAVGEMLDHVAANGSLNTVHPTPSVWEQFPLICPLVNTLYQGHNIKVTLMKAFLRTGLGHHHVVDPALAEAYFGHFTGRAGIAAKLVIDTYNMRSSINNYNITPYSRYKERYTTRMPATREEVFAMPDQPSSGWEARWSTLWVQVHHFKWHRALVGNLYHRFERDRGDCVLGVNEESCRPTFVYWRETAKTYLALSAGRPLDTARMRCSANITTFG